MSSQANAQAFQDADIEPLLAIKRESHHLTVMERFAPDEPPPETTDPLKRMAYQLGTQAGRALYSLRKQTVEPVFGILKRVMGWRQMSMRGLDKANGEWNLVTMAYNIKRMHVLRAVWGGQSAFCDRLNGLRGCRGIGKSVLVVPTVPAALASQSAYPDASQTSEYSDLNQ